METIHQKAITVQTTIKADIGKVWKLFNDPEAITKWNSGHPEWHTPSSENDLRVGGKFKHRMEAKDGSMGFDFEGIYTAVTEHKLMEYDIADGRKVKVVFGQGADGTVVTETFDLENIHSEEMQRAGWQGILDNFKAYAESH